MTSPETMTPTNAPSVEEIVRELLAAAYEAGCMAVQENFQPYTDPEFGEAAHDYASFVDLALLRSQGDWRPIERAPRDGTSILVIDSDESIVVTHWHEDIRYKEYEQGDGIWITMRQDEGYWETTPDRLCYPAFWQPLPAPPLNTTPEPVNEIGEGLTREGGEEGSVTFSPELKQKALDLIQPLQSHEVDQREQMRRVRDVLTEVGAPLHPPGDPEEYLTTFERIRALAARSAPAPQPKAGNGEIPETIYKAVERVLDENSAWIARPNAEVTKRVAIAAGIAAGAHWRDTAMAGYDRINSLAAHCAQAEAERDVLSARVGELEGALKPFAEIGEFFETETTGFSDLDRLDLCAEEGALLYQPSVGVFLRAQAALAKSEIQKHIVVKAERGDV